MFSNYQKQRKEFIRLSQLRELGDSIQYLTAGVMDIKYAPDFHIQMRELRARELVLLDAMVADIPWVCKVLPIK